MKLEMNDKELKKNQGQIELNKKTKFLFIYLKIKF